VRHVHLGLGNFFRAHQAWYSAHAPDGGEWGIAAFTGRRAEPARHLAAQDGLYTLTVRGPDVDRSEIVPVISAAHPAAEHDRLLDYFADPRMAVVTLTVTEAGYRRTPAGGLDMDDPEVAADLAALRADLAAPVATVPARLLAGLAARRVADAGPVAVIPCDNLPGNGRVVRGLLGELAGRVDAGLGEWMGESVAFVDTMVDRITPAVTLAEAEELRAITGWADRSPVLTEPFTEWVLGGDFPAGRPRWEAAGATFTDDVGPYDQRKLWLLNGAHSLLAYAAPLRGHRTVADAFADPTCAAWVEEWWDEVAPHLALPATDARAYRAALGERWSNRRIVHTLGQIAADGSQKLRVRVPAVVHGERAAGREASGGARILAGWLAHLRGLGVEVNDPAAAELRTRVAGDVRDAARRVLEFLDPELAADDDFVAVVVTRFAELTGPAG
jgi:fructuronate reductase